MCSIFEQVNFVDIPPVSLGLASFQQDHPRQVDQRTFTSQRCCVCVNKARSWRRNVQCKILPDTISCWYLLLVRWYNTYPGIFSGTSNNINMGL
mmetsp:Transcript_42258/g.88723  ORF Transcript_42258/g.88723 Transcript_42258/m.88723 type:complete len:94 (-) Transcript_42258:371-652(-)